jgi:prepilin-type N-terminal cleavage/methylation domain-containing protein
MKRGFVKRSFTLLELIVVIIIIGVLAILGFTQYIQVIERGRTAEARSNLGTLRQLLLAYNQENGAYFDNTYISTTAGLPTSSCNTQYYFRYTISSDTLTATRCSSGGKPPNGSSAYNLTITMNGTTGGQW